jgi:hypothetical protein
MLIDIPIHTKYRKSKICKKEKTFIKQKAPQNKKRGREEKTSLPTFYLITLSN